MSNLLTLKVKLQSAHLPIWRTVKIDSSLSFLDFHHVLQAAIGWQNEHLFQFEIMQGTKETQETIRISDPEFLEDDSILDAKTVKLSSFLTAKGKVLEYIYDFGDYWQHRIELTDIEPQAEEKVMAQCVAGKSACPPEDCGGVYGYQDLVEAIADPKNKEHADLLDWLGLEKASDFDAKAFNVADANKAVQKYFLQKTKKNQSSANKNFMFSWLF